MASRTFYVLEYSSVTAYGDQDVWLFVRKGAWTAPLSKGTGQALASACPFLTREAAEEARTILHPEARERTRVVEVEWEV